MNQTLSIVLVVAVLLVGGFLFFSLGQDAQDEDGATGQLFFSITDAAADIDAVSGMTMEVESVEVYSEAKGWVTVSDDEREYDLLTLRDENRAELFASIDAEVGTYGRVRLTIDEVTVHKTNGESEETVLVNNEVVIATTVNVKENTSTNVELDVLANKSLHTAVDGEYVFAPVIQVTSVSGADVRVESGTRTVTYSGGTVDSSVTVGVDVDGTTKVNFELGRDAVLDVSLFGSVQSTSSSNGDTTAGQSEASGSVEAGANSDASVDTGNGGASLEGSGRIETNVNGVLQN